MYRESYCQRRAIQLYGEEKSQEEVIAMLRAENAPEKQVESLAERFYQDYLFWVSEKRKQRRKAADRDILLGGVLLATGILFSLMSYLSIGDGQFVLFYGIKFVGVIFLVKGLAEQQQLKKAAQAQSHN